MADLPELQRRLLQRSRLLGFEPWSDSPLRQTGDRSSSDSDSSGDDIDCEGTACAGSRHRSEEINASKENLNKKVKKTSTVALEERGDTRDQNKNKNYFFNFYFLVVIPSRRL